MKTIITIFIFISLVTIAKSQTDSVGELQGRVFDASTNEGIPFAAVVLERDGAQKGIGQTDDNGNYTIKPIVPGNYELRVQCLGYVPARVQGIRITARMISFQNISLQQGGEIPNVVMQGNGGYVNCTPVRSNAIDQNAIALSADRVAVSPLNIGGTRDGGDVYIIDGMKVSCGIMLPEDQIEDITIITGGIPAKYENATDQIDFSELKTPDKSFAQDFPALHALRFQF